MYETLRSPERPTMGHRAAWIAGKLGLPFMPWQSLVADVGRELIPADDQTVDMYAARGVDVRGLMVPAYREVIVTIMRQNGKTTLVLPVVGECLWEPRRMAAYTAQSGVDARQKFVEDWTPILRNSPLDQKVRQYYKAADNTGMWWHNDSRLKVLNTGESAGHGKTLDLAVLDETWADKDDAREQALSPAMVTKPLAQFWNVSTAGTAASTFLKRKVDLGRAAVNSGRREGIAYFEWAIPDEEDVYSPVVWAKYMPAFGITISERVLRLEADRMSEGDFRRAYGNQWTETEERIIPGEWWAAVSKPGVAVSDGVVFSIEGRPDRSRGVVVKTDRNGTQELVAIRPGVSWMSAAFDQASPKPTIVVDGYGPAAVVADDLERDGYTVVRYDSLGVRKACGRWYDAISDRKVQFRSDERMDEAVRYATRRTTADSWMWHRDTTGGDLLMAASLGFDHAVTDEPVFPPFAWT